MTSGNSVPSAVPLALRLFRSLQRDDLDQAIRDGLMDYQASAADDQLIPEAPDLSRQLIATQQRLQNAWDARARHRQRAARLARRAAERNARRMPPPAPAAATQTPALPPLAAAILARAKAKAAGRKPQ